MATLADQGPCKDTTAAASRRYGLFIGFLLCRAFVDNVRTRLIDHRSEPVIVGVIISNAVYTTAHSTGVSMVVVSIILCILCGVRERPCGARRCVDSHHWRSLGNVR